jgi:hypothetical protein
MPPTTPDDLPAATAAPATLEHQGRSYHLAPLTFRLFGQITQMLRDRLIRSASQAIRDTPELTEQQQRTLLREAFDRAEALQFGQPSTMDSALMSDPTMLVRIVHLSLSQQHPELTEFDVDRMLPLTDPQRLEEVIDRLMHISGLKEPAPGVAGAGEGTKSADEPTGSSSA